MATRSQAYDHPAYLVPYIVSREIATGSATTVKFAAFTAMLVKSVTLSPSIAGTAADVVNVQKISGTSTTTQVLGTFTAATAGVNFAVSTMTLAQGDMVAVAKGADATGAYACTIELQLVPGANLTL